MREIVARAEFDAAGVGLYVRATTAGTSGFTAARLATAVIIAECTA
ncbi:hypothetical protein [Saccharothrix hoggarensis]|uniref:Uncharacterized protein n=1 Tax=Saccharothrix hoggarensis TaxID=913853 RepID=A0ABW3QWA7_9PSEU